MSESWDVLKFPARKSLISDHRIPVWWRGSLINIFNSVPKVILFLFLFSEKFCISHNFDCAFRTCVQLYFTCGIYSFYGENIQTIDKEMGGGGLHNAIYILHTFLSFWFSISSLFFMYFLSVWCTTEYVNFCADK
jgi:hypothetical protein